MSVASNDSVESVGNQIFKIAISEDSGLLGKMWDGSKEKLLSFLAGLVLSCHLFSLYVSVLFFS